jgi:hypothetical protein
MKKKIISSATFIFIISILFSGCSKPKNEEISNKLPLKTANEYLDIFRADGDKLITRPRHLGIVNSMASVGISHDYVGVLDGLWAIPLVSSDFYMEPRLWGEKVETDHYTWLPFQTNRIGNLRGIEVKSTTTLIYGMRAGVLTMNLKNTTAEDQEIPIQFIANSPFTYKVTLDKEEVWDFSTPISKTEVTNIVDDKRILRVQGEYALAIGGDLPGLWWEEPTRRFHGTINLKPGQKVATSLAFSIEEKEKAVKQRNDLLANRDQFIQSATDHYISEVKNIYDKLPRLTSDNKELEQAYNRSLSIFITNKFNVPEFIFNPYYGTGAVKGGCTVNYLWNFGQIFEILQLLDPEAAKQHIKQFIRSGGLYNAYAFYPLNGKSTGTWYMVNQEKIIRHVYHYVKLTGDTDFLKEEVVEGITILEMMIENAMHLDDITQPVKLVDYGVDYGATNSHLELRREYKYYHVMPDMNGRRYNNYKRVSELCELMGQPQPYLMERAEDLKVLLKKELWDPELKWFAFADSQGNKDMRYQAQMFKLFDSDVIDEEIKEGLISHLNEEEFLSDFGLHSMSKLDPAYDQVDIDNGGGGNCTSFTPLIIEFLYKDGKTEIADDLLGRILWWGSRMPYFSDSEPANEIDYRQDTPLQSNISTGVLAQSILFGMFGIDVAFDGTVTINPVNTNLANQLEVKGLKIRGKTIDISVKGDNYEVVSGNETIKNTIGNASVIQ